MYSGLVKLVVQILSRTHREYDYENRDWRIIGSGYSWNIDFIGSSSSKLFSERMSLHQLWFRMFSKPGLPPICILLRKKNFRLSFPHTKMCDKPQGIKILEQQDSDCFRSMLNEESWLFRLVVLKKFKNKPLIQLKTSSITRKVQLHREKVGIYYAG